MRCGSRMNKLQIRAQAFKKLSWVMAWERSGHALNCFQCFSLRLKPLAETYWCSMRNKSDTCCMYPSRKACVVLQTQITIYHAGCGPYPSIFRLCEIIKIIYFWDTIIKTHVRGFFENDLHEVSWHGIVGSKFKWPSEHQCQRSHLKWVFVFIPHLKK